MKKALVFTLSILSFYCQQASAQYNQWHSLPNYGLSNKGAGRFEDIYFLDTLTGFAACFYDCIYKTTDGGKHWKTVAGGAGTNFRSIEFSDNGKYGIAGSLNGQLYRSTDTGNTWTEISSAITDTTTISPKSMCGLSHFGNIFYGVGWWGSKTARFYKSIDSGVTWTTSYMDTTIVNGLVDVQFISKDTGFVTGGVNATTGWSAASVRTRILKTTDGGVTWKVVFSDSVVGGRVWKIQILDRHFMVASIEPYYRRAVCMLKSTDVGETWKMIYVDTSATVAPGIGTQGIGFLNQNDGTLGGWYPGRYQTHDGGSTWTYSLAGNNINRHFRVDATHLYEGGDSVYLYKYKPAFQDTTVYNRTTNPTVKSRTAVPEPEYVHKLYPVSPNPTTGKIKIEFDLGGQSNVVLEIANADTRQVFRIENKMLVKGHYTYYWDGSHMPAGNYFVWLGNDQIPVSQKFVITH